MQTNKKIFLGYMIIFVITMITGFLLGRYVFQEIYEYTKKSELKNQIKRLKESDISTENLKNLEKRLNADIIAYDNDNEYNIKSKFEHIMVKDSEGKVYTIILDNLSDDLNEKMSFNTNKITRIVGYNIFDEYYIIPIEITFGNKTYVDYEIDRGMGENNQYELITLEGLDLMEVSLRNILKEDFLEILLKTYVEYHGFNENLQFTDIDNYDDKERYEVIVEIIGDKKLILVYSYSNISMLFGELKSYFLYLILIGFCLIAILTIFFTNIITKPILKITKITNKITKLNFDEQLDIKNHDEIGELATNINNLGNALGTALRDLEKDKKNTKELMGNLSHEFKTPLTIISGYVDLLKEDNDKKYLDIISEEVDKLTILIEETTKAMSLDSQIVNLNIEKLDIKELILNITEKFQVNISDNLRLEHYLEDNIMVEADRNKIEQVIYNFISNAIRHANTYVMIELKKIGKNVIFSVRNDGIKLKDDEKEKVWLKFFKTTRENKGNLHRSGLGLYISKSILKLHKANYGAENTKDGVIFYFLLKGIDEN